MVAGLLKELQHSYSNGRQLGEIPRCQEKVKSGVEVVVEHVNVELGA